MSQARRVPLEVLAGGSSTPEAAAASRGLRCISSQASVATHRAEVLRGPAAISALTKTVAAAPDLTGTFSWQTRFAIRSGRRTVFVDANDVEWIEAGGDYATLHVRDNTYLLRESLHRLAGRLDPRRFVRVHRSTIVRVDSVREIRALPNRDALLRLHDGTPLRASRTYVDLLLARLRSPVSSSGLTRSAGAGVGRFEVLSTGA